MNGVNIDDLLQQFSANLLNLNATGQQQQINTVEEPEQDLRIELPIKSIYYKIQKKIVENFLNKKKASNKPPEAFIDTFTEYCLDEEGQESLEYLDTIYEGQKINKGVCSKILNFGEPCYTCKDCEMDHTCIICANCFENGNHEGHRFELKKAAAGMCDCGDLEAWKESGFCCDHKGFIDEHDPYIEEEKQRCFTKTIKITLWIMIQSLEQIKSKKKMLKLSNLLGDFLGYINELKDSYPLLGIAIGQALLTPLQIKGVGAPMYHKCDDYTGIQNILEIPETCSCTTLRLFLRYFSLVIGPARQAIKNFIVSMFSYYPFKVHFAVEYLRMVNFVVFKGKGELETNEKSIMSDLSVQIMTSEELAYLAIKEAGTDNMLEGIKRSIDQLVQVDREAENPPKPEDFDDDKYWITENEEDSLVFAKFNNTFTYYTLYNFRYTMMKQKGVLEFFKTPSNLDKFFAIFTKINRFKLRLLYSPGFADFSSSSLLHPQFNLEINAYSLATQILSCLTALPSSSAFPLLSRYLRHSASSLSDSFATDQRISSCKPDYGESHCLIAQKLFVYGVVATLAIHYSEKNDQLPQNLEIRISLTEWGRDALFNLWNEVWGKNQQEEIKSFWRKMGKSFAGAAGIVRELANQIWVSKYSNVGVLWRNE